MEDFLSKHGIGIRTKRTLQDGRTMWILDHCPRNHDHTGTSVAVLQTPNGVNQFNCQHDSCQNVTWSQMRAEIDTEYALRKAEWKASPKISNSRETTANCGDGDAVELLQAPPPYVPPPLALLPALMREYVQAAAEAINVDIGYILLPFLSALGNAIGNARSILLKSDFIQPPIIWTGIIGRSGQRKSPAIDAGCFAVMEHERELMRENKAAFD